LKQYYLFGSFVPLALPTNAYITIIHELHGKSKSCEGFFQKTLRPFECGHVFSKTLLRFATLTVVYFGLMIYSLQVMMPSMSEPLLG